MPADPTTWRSTPVCATEAMIEAGAAALRAKYPMMARRVARSDVKIIINAALKANKPPQLHPEPPATGDAGHG